MASPLLIQRATCLPPRPRSGMGRGKAHTTKAFLLLPCAMCQPGALSVPTAGLKGTSEVTAAQLGPFPLHLAPCFAFHPACERKASLVSFTSWFSCPSRSSAGGWEESRHILKDSIAKRWEGRSSWASPTRAAAHHVGLAFLGCTRLS